jgi:ribosomal protein S6--L-glutamate ligase
MNIGIITFSAGKPNGVTYPEAEKIAATAREMGHEANVYASRFFSFFFDENGTRLAYKEKEFPKIDVAISRVHVHKNTADRMAALRDLEILGIPVVNRFLPNLRAKNKFHTFQLLAAKGLPVIKTAIVANAEYLDFALEHIEDFPIVAKAASGVEGKGVAIFESKRSLVSGLEMILQDTTRLDSIILQEFIPTGNVDYRIVVVDGEVVGQMERRAQEGEFRANLSVGGSGGKVELPSEILEIAKEATKALDLDISGVDILMTESGPKICEINSCPGLKIEKVTGAKICEAIIKCAEKRAKK